MSIDFTYATSDQEVYQKKEWNKKDPELNAALFNAAREKHNSFLSDTIENFSGIEGLFPVFNPPNDTSKFDGFCNNLLEAARKEALKKKLPLEEGSVEYLEQTNAGKMYKLLRKLPDIGGDLSDADQNRKDEKTRALSFKRAAKSINELLKYNENGVLELREILYSYLNENGYDNIDKAEFNFVEELCNALETIDQHAQILNRQETYISELKSTGQLVEDFTRHQHAVVESLADMECSEEFKTSPETFETDIKGAETVIKNTGNEIEAFDKNVPDRIAQYQKAVDSFEREVEEFKKLDKATRQQEEKLTELESGENGYVDFCNNYQNFLNECDKEEKAIKEKIKVKQKEYDDVSDYGRKMNEKIAQNTEKLLKLQSDNEFYKKISSLESRQSLLTSATDRLKVMETNPTANNFNIYVGIMEQIFAADGEFHPWNRKAINGVKEKVKKNISTTREGYAVDKNDYQKIAKELNSYFAEGLTKRIFDLTKEKNDVLKDADGEDLTFLAELTELEAEIAQDESKVKEYETNPQVEIKKKALQNELLGLKNDLNKVNDKLVDKYRNICIKYGLKGEFKGDIKAVNGYQRLFDQIQPKVEGLSYAKGLSVAERDTKNAHIQSVIVSEIRSEKNAPAKIEEERAVLTAKLDNAFIAQDHAEKCKHSYELCKNDYSKLLEDKKNILDKISDKPMLPTGQGEKKVDFCVKNAIVNKLRWYDNNKNNAYLRGHINGEKYKTMTAAITTAIDAVNADNNTLEDKVSALKALHDAADAYKTEREKDSLVWGTDMRKARLKLAASIIKYTKKTMDTLNKDLSDMAAEKEIHNNIDKINKLAISDSFEENTANIKNTQADAIEHGKAVFSTALADQWSKMNKDREDASAAKLKEYESLTKNGQACKKKIMAAIEKGKKTHLAAEKTSANKVLDGNKGKKLDGNKKPDEAQASFVKFK